MKLRIQANIKKVSLTPPPPPRDLIQPPAQVEVQNTSLPVWVRHPDTPTMVGSIGKAESNAMGDLSSQRNEASTSAREELNSRVVSHLASRFPLSEVAQKQISTFLDKHISVSEYFTDKSDGSIYAHATLQNNVYQGLVKILQERGSKTSAYFAKAPHRLK